MANDRNFCRKDGRFNENKANSAADKIDQNRN